jgi:NarL family two-component system response regulator LiaR
MKHKIRVILVNHHPIVRRGLASFFSTFDDIEMVGEATNGEIALQHIEKWMPDVMILEMLIPGNIDGIETIRRVGSLLPYTKIVVTTSHADDARILAALSIGAMGYVRQEADPACLIAAIRAAARGQALLDPPIASAMMQELMHSETSRPKLTAREQTILRQFSLGRTHAEIADVLAVPEEMVLTHVGNILTKLQLIHRTQAMLYALKKGLIHLDEIELP